MARAFSIEDGNITNDVTVNATQNREYKDLDLSFTAKGAGDVYKKSSIASVKQSLKTLLRTNRTEKPFAPYFGANLDQYLFELLDQGTVSEMKQAIVESIRVYEPRIDYDTVEVIMNPEAEQNLLTITIIFQIINSTKQSEFTTRLNRLR
jgi:phage baseplate assembly protein W